MDLKNLIIDDPQAGIFRVHRSTMTSPDILELERRRIFDKCWLYLGHESEVPHPGAYLRRTVAGRPLIFLRDSEGQVRAFFNTCTHRGALICRRDQGTADVFQCFYHAWTFNTKGELIGIPDEAGYGSGFDRTERALQAPPRMECYRGFYFVSFNPDIEDLRSYLGEARFFLDLVSDQGEHGIRVLPGSAQYTIRANWKLLVENSIDIYHVPTTHQTYLHYITSRGLNTPRPPEQTWGLALGNGHAAVTWPAGTGIYNSAPPRYSDETRAQLARIRARLAQRYGEQGAQWTPGRFNAFIYPNLFFIGLTTMRQMWPLTHESMEVSAWMLAPVEESGARLAERIHDVPLFQGPGGFATPDDVEALESCQQGFQAQEVEWSDISRGMQRRPHDNDELQMRAFWRQWHAQIQGRVQADHWDDPPVVQHQPVDASEPSGVGTS